MARRRGKSVGRFESGKHFAAIPVEVMRSAAYAALPDYAARVLQAMAAQYRGANNGNLSLTVRDAKELGLRSAWKVQAGLRLLIETRHVLVTRQGKYSHGRGICALYALSWKPINISPAAFPPIDNERPASNAWEKWIKPNDWDAIESTARRQAKGKTQSWEAAHDHSSRGEQASSSRGEQESAGSHATSSSRGEQETELANSSRGGGLLDSGQVSPSTSRQRIERRNRNEGARRTHIGPQDSPVRGDSASTLGSADVGRLLAMLKDQPHLSDRDLAGTFRTNHTVIATYRERIARLTLRNGVQR